MTNAVSYIDRSSDRAGYEPYRKALILSDGRHLTTGFGVRVEKGLAARREERDRARAGGGTSGLPVVTSLPPSTHGGTAAYRYSGHYGLPQRQAPARGSLIAITA